MHNKNEGFGPTSLILTILLGGFLFKKLKEGFGEKIYQPQSLIEPSVPFDWQPIINIGYWLLVLAVIAGIAYLVFLLVKHLYFKPFSEIENKMNDLLASHNETQKNSSWVERRLDNHVEKTRACVNSHKDFINGHAKYSGYESYLKSQEALEEIKESGPTRST